MIFSCSLYFIVLPFILGSVVSNWPDANVIVHDFIRGPVGIIGWQFEDHYSGIFLLDPSYTSDFRPSNKIHGYMFEPLIVYPTYNIGYSWDTTFENLFYDVKEHFLYLKHNNVDYKLTRLYLAKDGRTLYYAQIDCWSTFRAYIYFDTTILPTFYKYNGIWYDIGTNTYYAVVNGKVVYQIIPKII